MFATSLMNATFQEQHSSKVTDQSLSIVSSKQQEKSQASIEEESVSNLDPDIGS